MTEERVYNHGNFIDDEDEFSSDEECEEEEIIYDENGMPICPEDEEEIIKMRRIVSETILNKSFSNLEFNEIPIEKKEKPIKEPKNKTLSLSELNTLIEKQIEESKPKKFISKRITDKTHPTKQVIVTKHRDFNPRFPPYLLSDEYKNRTNKKRIFELDCKSFPSLNI
tara:strand:+ start:1306 stop:1809 length:504 start_codon:yes stop_codon:yes gene_type:complete